jgi:hypothetical protein
MQPGKRSTARTPFSQKFNLSVRRIFWFYAAAGIYEMASRNQSLEWVPSQNGMVFECLHAHQAAIFDSVISTCRGSKPVPSCEPSQNGWLFERPHAHHQYVPGSTFCTIGDFWKMIGSLIDGLCRGK